MAGFDVMGLMRLPSNVALCPFRLGCHSRASLGDLVQ